MDITTPAAQPSPEQMEDYMRQWHAWIHALASEHKLADGGNHFSPEGTLLKPGNRSLKGPYTSEGISVAGYILIYAQNMREAVRLAKKCPILSGENTSVEIRETAAAGA